MNCSCQIRWSLYAFSRNKTAAKKKLWKSWKSWKEFTYRKRKKQRLSAKIMTRPIVQSAPNAIDCNVYIYENSCKNTLSKCLNGFLEVLALIVLAQLNVYGISVHHVHHITLKAINDLTRVAFMCQNNFSFIIFLLLYIATVHFKRKKKNVKIRLYRVFIELKWNWNQIAIVKGEKRT